VLTVYWNSCNGEPLPLEVTEADDHVAVRLTERWNVGPVLLYARRQRASARLRQPLGERTVIDATTGQPRPGRDPPPPSANSRTPRGSARVRSVETGTSSPSQIALCFGREMKQRSSCAGTSRLGRRDALEGGLW
jgi:hypothetical protein